MGRSTFQPGETGGDHVPVDRGTVAKRADMGSERGRSGHSTRAGRLELRPTMGLFY